MEAADFPARVGRQKAPGILARGILPHLAVRAPRRSAVQSGSDLSEVLRIDASIPAAWIQTGLSYLGNSNWCVFVLDSVLIW